TLHQLLHPDLIYGHSNGWVETKTELLQNLASGKMHYSSIFSEEPEFKRTGDVISVRTKSRIAFVVNEKAGELDLFVVQVWKKEIDGWKLLVRQSTRLN
ncbi:MAG: nuclear transport factor 2 family protein, partial [Flavisolibacter sp.]|nr:nuclear transport factor 2 family protein [Flavisolibacter sp.]